MSIEQDKVKLMNAVMDIHNELAVHLKDRCDFEIDLDGVPLKVSLEDAINFAIGVEMGVTMGQIMQVTERKQFANLGESSMAVLQRVLGDYVEKGILSKK